MHCIVIVITEISVAFDDFLNRELNMLSVLQEKRPRVGKSTLATRLNNLKLRLTSHNLSALIALIYFYLRSIVHKVSAMDEKTCCKI